MWAIAEVAATSETKAAALKETMLFVKSEGAACKSKVSSGRSPSCIYAKRVVERVEARVGGAF